MGMSFIAPEHIYLALLTVADADSQILFGQ